MQFFDLKQLDCTCTAFGRATYQKRVHQHDPRRKSELWAAGHCHEGGHERHAQRPAVRQLGSLPSVDVRLSSPTARNFRLNPKPPKETPRTNQMPKCNNLSSKSIMNPNIRDSTPIFKLTFELSLPEYAAAGHREPAAAVHATRCNQTAGLAFLMMIIIPSSW